MKIDRDTYSIGEALQMIAEELAPIPSGPLTKLRASGAWFGEGELGGSFTPVWFGSNGRFPTGMVEGPFTPVQITPIGPLGLMPGERIGVPSESAEELDHAAERDVAFLRMQTLIANGDIRPLNHHDRYVLQWDTQALAKSVAHYRISAVDFGKLCAAMPVSVAAEDDVQPVSASAGSATPVLRSETGEDRKRVMLEMRETGLSDEEVGVQFGVTRQRVSQLIDTKAAARAAPKKPSK